MFNAFGTMTANIYCTKIASKLVRTYTDRHGLRDLCRELLGIDLSKQQQSSDWGAQTLTEAQIAYAASDVLHLHALRSRLDTLLAREGRAGYGAGLFRVSADARRARPAGMARYGHLRPRVAVRKGRLNLAMPIVLTAHHPPANHRTRPPSSAMTDSVLLPGPSRLSTTPIGRQDGGVQARGEPFTEGAPAAPVILVGAIGSGAGVDVFAFFDPFRACSCRRACRSTAPGSTARPSPWRTQKCPAIARTAGPTTSRAESAVQNLKTPSVLQLNTLDAHVGDDRRASRTSRPTSGVYDTTKELMDLKGNIHITSETGADIRMRVRPHRVQRRQRGQPGAGRPSPCRAGP